METLTKHEGDHKPQALDAYTETELALWVHLLRKRADLHIDSYEAKKDVCDADNYEQMLKEKMRQNGTVGEQAQILSDINSTIMALASQGNLDINQVSDGYHTFGELYTHRHLLWVKLCAQLFKNPHADFVWRSKRHADGELAFGGTWFVLGYGLQEGNQITYHLPIEYWDHCGFAKTEACCPWDGHTAADVPARLMLI